MPGSPRKRQRREALARYQQGKPPWPSDIPFLREAGINITDDGDVLDTPLERTEEQENEREREEPWLAGVPEDIRALLEQLVDEPTERTFSHRTVQRMAFHGNSDRDIALLLRIDRKKLQTEAKEALELGRAQYRYLLTFKQFGAATVVGDRSLLIFLGKIRLGQSDRTTTELSGPGGGPIEVSAAAAIARAKLGRIIAPTQRAPAELPPTQPDFESPASDTHASTDVTT